MFGASLGELGFVALMVAIVLLSQVAPRVGEAIGARRERGQRGAGPDPAPRLGAGNDGPPA